MKKLVSIASICLILTSLHRPASSAEHTIWIKVVNRFNQAITEADVFYCQDPERDQCTSLTACLTYDYLPVVLMKTPLKTSIRSAKYRRIRAAVVGSVVAARTLICPPHLGQASASTSKTR